MSPRPARVSCSPGFPRVTGVRTPRGPSGTSGSSAGRPARRPRPLPGPPCARAPQRHWCGLSMRTPLGELWVTRDPEDFPATLQSRREGRRWRRMQRRQPSAAAAATPGPARANRGWRPLKLSESLAAGGGADGAFPGVRGAARAVHAGRCGGVLEKGGPAAPLSLRRGTR